MVSKSTQAANTTRAQKAKKVHEKASKERAKVQEQVSSLYQQAYKEEDPILMDIIQKLQKFSDYHTKMARDGVGAKATGDFYENGQPVMETVYFDPAKRVTELDKSAGLLEAYDYIMRQVEPPKPKTK